MTMPARALMILALVPMTGCYVNAANRMPTPSGIQVRIDLRACPPEGGACLPEDATHAEGQLLVLEAESLVMYDRRRRVRSTIDVSMIEQVHVFRGYHPSGEAALKKGAQGAAGGAVIGTMLGLVAGALGADVGEAVLVGAVEGAATGFMDGVIEGATLGDRVWEAVSVRELREELCQCLLPDRIAQKTGPGPS